MFRYSIQYTIFQSKSATISLERHNISRETSNWEEWFDIIFIGVCPEWFLTKLIRSSVYLDELYWAFDLSAQKLSNYSDPSITSRYHVLLLDRPNFHSPSDAYCKVLLIAITLVAGHSVALQNQYFSLTLVCHILAAYVSSSKSFKNHSNSHLFSYLK